MPSAPSWAMPTPCPQPRPVRVMIGEAVAVGAAQSTTARAASVFRTRRSLATGLQSGAVEPHGTPQSRFGAEPREPRRGVAGAPPRRRPGPPPQLPGQGRPAVAVLRIRVVEAEL